MGREVALQERALEAAAEKMSRENADETLASLASTDSSSHINRKVN